jgi:hypothetical protein
MTDHRLRSGLAVAAGDRDDIGGDLPPMIGAEPAQSSDGVFDSDGANRSPLIAKKMSPSATVRESIETPVTVPGVISESGRPLTAVSTSSSVSGFIV